MVTTQEIREKYIKFFEKRGHIVIDPAPLVLTNDPTTLFTSSGMQPLVPYLMGEKHPSGSKRLVDSQPSIRLQDIEEVGDNRHTTFFEMLGNWSLGDYFKKEQLSSFWEFLTEEVGLDKNRLFVSVFKGNDLVQKDTESYEIWRSLGVSEDHIFYYDVKKNWWSRSGTPDQMPVGEIGGPDSEVFYDFGKELKLHENSIWKDEECHPNCDCGRFMEIGNSVFIQYKKTDKGLEELPQKNVDFGGGLERITAAANNDPDVFKTDSFKWIINQVEEKYDVKYSDSEKINKSLRIIADHARASSALIGAGILPSNKQHGYILRRLIRRMVLHLRNLNSQTKISIPYADIQQFGVPVSVKDKDETMKILEEETDKFVRVMENGIKIMNNLVDTNKQITGEVAFNLYQSYGFPLELTLEFLISRGLKFSSDGVKKFEKEFEEHKEKSRSLSAGVFKGGLSDHSPEVVRFHTATHILLASLRKVLGDHVVQLGQNITKDRSRFDFPNSSKLTEEQIHEVEKMINEVVDKSLPVSFVVLPKEEAIKTGAIHAFNEKYADTVKVYFVGESLETAFSKEFCGGPHVTNTSEIGHVTINKQEKIGSGVIRIYVRFSTETKGKD